MLAAKGLTKRFGGLIAVNEVDLEVSEGEFGSAIASFQRNMALPTSGVDGFVRLGDLYLRIGPAAPAEKAFRGALARRA